LNTKRPSNVPEEPDEPSFSMVEEEYPVDRLRSRFNESLGGRPLTVYLVLFAGAAMLLLLLGVVWISATGGGDKDELICTEIAPQDARDAVLAGQVRRVNVLVDKDRPIESLTGIQLRFADDSCRQTPQGADIRNDLFVVIGAVDLYNNFQDDTIRVHYQSQEIETELLSTSTATPAPTATSTTAPATSTAAAATATQPAPTATPVSSPTASPTSQSSSAPTSESGQKAPVGDVGS
jgi:cell division septation protein DedD